MHLYRYATEGTFDSYLWQTVENKQKFISQIMTSKSPVRSCDDVDETALSYAEIKALCAGNPLIREKMDLDVEVSKLRLLKASHQSQKYQMEDRLLKFFPEQMERIRGNIAGFQMDLALAERTAPPKGEFAGMEVSGRSYIEKEAAGAAILHACQNVKELHPLPLGEYRGFTMSLALENFGKDYVLTLKGEKSHRVMLGTDPGGMFCGWTMHWSRLPNGCRRSKPNWKIWSGSVKHQNSRQRSLFRRKRNFRKKAPG